MFEIFREEMEWGGRPLSLETGHIARQSDGAVKVTYGETTVLCTVVGVRDSNPDQDFFPLTVHYQEKAFSAGRIPGGFFKREGRPSEHEVLVSRLIDRPLRPLFPKGFKNEVQVICTVLSYDSDAEADIAALIGASAALTISGIPFLGPIGAARVGYIDGAYVLNPSFRELENSSLDLVVAGTKTGVLMVESEASELSEEVMLGAVEFGHKSFLPVIDAVIRLAERCAKDPWPLPEEPTLHQKVRPVLLEKFKDIVQKTYQEPDKKSRYHQIKEVRAQAQAYVEETFPNQVSSHTVLSLFKEIEHEVVRRAILAEEKRIDGRGPKDIRPIMAQVQILPRTHGSALFTRGETQVLAVATLGTGEDEQIIDALEGEYRETFLLHYNFPPFSVGETGRLGSPGRREVGHGKLAWRALHPILPKKEAFPYTIRVVAEVMECNGSSSMASVCGASLAMMDGGVPLSRAVAGIAMGLIKEGAQHIILSDILGDEDHLGDMDFKVAGTEQGVTALQMDIKIGGITHKIMEDALAQAKSGRLHILSQMAKGLPTARTELSDTAPRIETISVPREKIREIIGTGGKVIREICETTGVKIDIEDDGTTRIAAADGNAIKAALQMIQNIIAEPEVGQIHTGKVVKTAEFGAFVAYMGSHQGLVHISEMAHHRVVKVTDIVSVGDEVRVKVIAIDDTGKVRLSMKALLTPPDTGSKEENSPSPIVGG